MASDLETPSSPSRAVPGASVGQVDAVGDRRGGGRRRALAALAPIPLLVALLALTVYQVMLPGPLEEARAAEQAKDPLTALRRAMDELGRHPGSPQASLLAARNLSRLRFPERAEPYYRQARRAGPLSVEDVALRAAALQHRARDLLATDRTEQAIAMYQEILDHQPDEPEALRGIAALRLTQHRTREALQASERLAALPGYEAKGYALMGAIHHDRNSAAKAAAAYEKVVELDPELRTLDLPAPIFWTNLAQDLLNSGQPAKAKRYMLRSLEGRKDAVQMDLLGQAYQVEGDLAKAEDCYRRASEWEPNLAGPWLHLGRLRIQERRNEDAIAYLEKAESLAPDSFEPVYSLSLAHRRLGHDDEAERYRKRSEELRKLAAPPSAGMGSDSGTTP
jgi:tetratricopeptide (TPR) repeat protein